MPEGSDRDLLLSSDFLSSCVGMFSFPCRGNDKNSRGFQKKHLNIVDPLKENNNLGRSISKGNFYRIRSAFSYGARKLARILLQPEDLISNELQKFFSNTIARHGDVLRHDIQDFDINPSIIYNSAISAAPIPDSWLHKIDNFNGYTASSGDFQFCSGKLSQESDTSTRELLDLEALKLSDTAAAKPYFAPPHLLFSNSKLHNLNTRDQNSDSDKINSSIVLSGSDEDKHKDVFRATKSLSVSGDTSHTDSGQGSASRIETPQSLNSLSDLTGDYESYLKLLQYGRWCYEYGLGIHSLPMPPLPTIPYQSNGLWDGIAPLSHFKQNGFSHRLLNGFHPIPALYPVQQPVLLPGAPFGWDEMGKPRGTGTYFPNMNQPPLGYRSSSMKGRNQVPPSRAPHINGRNMVFMEANMIDRSSNNEVSQQTQVPIDRSVMLSSSDSYLSFPPQANGYPHNANALFIKPEAIVELELEKSRQQSPVSSSPRTFSGMQRSQPAFSREQDRISLGSSYRLKDEEDFPPLPV